MIKTALIIAAGNGSRLSEGAHSAPKPLRSLAGLSLIKRIILSSKKAGIRDFVIVVGYKKDIIINELQKYSLGVTLRFVENDDWKKSNGISVLAARPYIKENFVLLMSDHIFDPKTLENLKQVPLGGQKAILAVDRKINDIFDMDDATKVVVEGQHISRIGKQLTDYNAIDTGMFLCSPGLFDVLEEAKKDGNCSLSDGIQLLAARNQMGAYDIGDGFWQDVDTPEALRFAEKQLFQACRKPTDGIISRNLNRPISLFMSRFFVKTPLSANHVTGITTLVGILSAYLTAKGDYWSVLWGAFFFQLSSIMDGCDGEVSKLKMTASKMGQWLDTISDNFTYMLYMFAVIIGMSRQHYAHIAPVGTLTVLGLLMTLLVMFTYLIRNTGSGSLVTIQKDFQRNIHQAGFFKKFLAKIQFMVKRDFFALFFFCLALFGQLKVILWLCLIGSNATWIVLLTSKLFKAEGFSKESSVPR